MAKVKVTDNGEEIEVQLPKGYVGPEELASGFVAKDFFEAEIGRRLSAARKGLVKKDEILADKDFREEALKTWGVVPRDEKEIEKVREAIRTSELTPVLEKLKKAETRLQKASRIRLEARLLNKARELNLVDSLLTPPMKGAPAPIVGMLGGYFVEDEERDDFFLPDPSGQGYMYSAKPSAEAPYKTPEEFVEEWAKGAGKPFVKDTRQRVGGSDGNGVPSGAQKSGTKGDEGFIIPEGGTVNFNDPLEVGRFAEAIAAGKAIPASPGT